MIKEEKDYWELEYWELEYKVNQDLLKNYEPQTKLYEEMYKKEYKQLTLEDLGINLEEED